MYSLYSEDGFYYSIAKANREKLEEIIANKNDYYYNKEIPKKGSTRKLKCLKKDSPLYDIQINLLNNFLNKVPLADNVYGFVKGYSYSSFLSPHSNKAYFLRIDIKDFFSSIDKTVIENVFKTHFRIKNEESNNRIFNYVLEIITIDNILPQGAVTSPVISNIVFRPLDIRIQKYCDRLGFTYSRYADDLLFSSNSINILKPFFVKLISKMLSSSKYKFIINYNKIMRCKKRISLNGFVIEKNIRISRSKKKDIVKILYLFGKGGKPANIDEYLLRLNSESYESRKKLSSYFPSKNSLLNYLCGYRSFLISWLTVGKEQRSYIKSLIKRIESLVNNVEKLN